MLAPSCHYNDGKSAARHAVTLDLTADPLRIVGDGGQIMAVWRKSEIHGIDEPGAGVPARFASGGDARLTLDDPETLQRLLDAVPSLGRRRRPSAAAVLQVVAGVAAVLALMAGLYLAFPVLIERLAAYIPVSWEEAAGKAAADRLIARLSAGGECREPAGTAALERLTGRLAAAVETPFRFRVRVADAAMANAFAAPGGHIVLLRGLVESAETSEEVAGVLAHEMGHVIERHATEAMLRNAGIKVVLGPLLGDPSSLMPDLGKAAAVVLTLSFSRKAEREADGRAVGILTAAGIGGGLARFLDRLAESEGEAIAYTGFLSTHPEARERARAARQARKGAAAMPPEDWTALKGICQSPADSTDS